MSSETIAAISTPPGKGAVGIVRLSGAQALSITAELFQADNAQPLAQWQAGQMILGALRGTDGAVLDRPLCCIRREPASYTGEDMVEFHCHGSPAILTLVLEALFSKGARMAQAGEFTKRAFLNGKLDLAEAEAVGDLIDAAGEAAVKNAAAQLGGALSRRIDAIYQPLVDTAAHFHAVLDYPDEDLDPFTIEQLAATLEQTCAQTQALTESYHRGKFYAGGIPCAIVGAPNSGKSSLLNALLGYERAIVTDIAGTTRDTVEERISIAGQSLRLIDTAGLRESGDVVERLGIERSRAAMEQASLILWVVDASRPLTQEDEAVRALLPPGTAQILLLNKADLPMAEGLPTGLPISAKSGSGLDALAAQISQLFPSLPHEALGSVLTNARQYDAAQRAAQTLQAAAQSLRDGMPPDAVVADLELALEALGELNGTSIREDITARIFKKFCVGK